MDDAALLALIKRSKILTEKERDYWITNLSHMNAEQKGKLVAILQKADDIPWTEQVQKYFSMVSGSAKSAAASL